jgi:hypothetical protein
VWVNNEAFSRQSFLSSDCDLAAMLDSCPLLVNSEIPENPEKHDLFTTSIRFGSCAMVLGVCIGDRELQQNMFRMEVGIGTGCLGFPKPKGRGHPHINNGGLHCACWFCCERQRSHMLGQICRTTCKLFLCTRVPVLASMAPDAQSRYPSSAA